MPINKMCSVNTAGGKRMLLSEGWRDYSRTLVSLLLY